MLLPFRKMNLSNQNTLPSTAKKYIIISDYFYFVKDEMIFDRVCKLFPLDEECYVLNYDYCNINTNSFDLFLSYYSIKYHYSEASTMSSNSEDIVSNSFSSSFGTKSSSSMTLHEYSEAEFYVFDSISSSSESKTSSFVRKTSSNVRESMSSMLEDT